MDGDILRSELNQYCNYWFKPVADSPMSLTILIKRYDQAVHNHILSRLGYYLSGQELLFPSNLSSGQFQVMDRLFATPCRTGIQIHHRDTDRAASYVEFNDRGACIDCSLQRDSSGAITGGLKRFADLHIVKFSTRGEWVPRFAMLALEQIFQNHCSDNPVMIIDRDGYPPQDSFVYVLMQ